MVCYAVIDTNVVVSAMIKRNSIPGSILELIFQGPIIPVLNDKILNEYLEVLSRPKFHLTKEIIDTVINSIKRKAIFVNEGKIDIELPDPKDVVFYEVVMEKRKQDETYLVTGNIKHFPSKTFIVTPKEFIDIILNFTKD